MKPQKRIIRPACSSLLTFDRQLDRLTDCAALMLISSLPIFMEIKRVTASDFLRYTVLRMLIVFHISFLISVSFLAEYQGNSWETDFPSLLSSVVFQSICDDSRCLSSIFG